MKKLRNKIKVLAALGLLLTPIPMNGLNLKTESSNHSVFLARENGSNKVVDNIEYGHNFTTMTEDGLTHKSSDGAQFVIGNSDSIQTLETVGIIKNHSDQSQKINVVFTTPKFEAGLMGVQTIVNEEPQLSQDITTTGENMVVYYSGLAGKYVLKDEFLTEYTWSDLLGVQIIGELNGNENIEISFTYSHEELTKEILFNLTRLITIRSFGYMPSMADSSYTMFRFASPSELPTNTLYAVQRNEDGTYTTYDNTVQSLLPDLDDSNINVHNFHEYDKFDSHENLFSGGAFSLNLDFINESIKDEGYSVGALDNKTFRNHYFYSLSLETPPIINDDQGNPVQIPNNSLYVEIHKVIDAIDSEITVGDSWDSKDNLTAVTSPYDKSNLVDKIEVDGTVDVSKKGVYPIKYSLIFDNTAITKTINVTVNEKTITEGSIITHYQSNDGLKIKDSNTQVLPIGSTYKTVAEQIIIFNGNKYELIEAPSNSSGVVSNQLEEVIYTYELSNIKPTAPIEDNNTNNKLESVI